MFFVVCHDDEIMDSGCARDDGIRHSRAMARSIGNALHLSCCARDRDIADDDFVAEISDKIHQPKLQLFGARSRTSLPQLGDAFSYLMHAYYREKKLAFGVRLLQPCAEIVKQRSFGWRKH